MESQKLPSWFQVQQPSDAAQSTTSSKLNAFNGTRAEDQSKQEEVLRSDLYTYCCRMLDDILKVSTNVSHEVALETAISFVCPTQYFAQDEKEAAIFSSSKNSATRNDDSQTTTSRKRERTAALHHEFDLLTDAEKRRKFNANSISSSNPNLLPCCVLHTNSTSILDRSYLVQHFCHKEQFRSDHNRAKICLLSRQGSNDFSSPLMSRNKDFAAKTAAACITLADLMKRIAFQCLSPAVGNNNYPDNETSYRWLLKKIKTITVRECMELILHWAKHTQDFDCIVVVLEVSATMGSLTTAITLHVRTFLTVCLLCFHLSSF